VGGLVDRNFLLHASFRHLKIDLDAGLPNIIRDYNESVGGVG